ncbi:MAG: type II toxin-antitoxin system Phd/YefM family antitoxin, partial [Candidatus Chisholmbacteria bacterium]|nr:type II toxin-antitoxin system Phd/YefM family antitoxin [Candidatus Chisholmbacteria bacterium]
MKNVSVYDFRTNLATYLDLVKSSGANVVVKRFNKPVAMLSPYRKDKLDFGP